ncbi:MAG TPA: hypothetical protein VJK54_01295 [Chthoniobacterales bacterium]|nr:hypothetical protein [Chthoniobacterales bacterium]
MTSIIKKIVKIRFFGGKHLVNPLIEDAPTNYQNSSDSASSSSPRPSSISYLPSPAAIAASPTSHLPPPTTMRPVGRIVAFGAMLFLMATSLTSVLAVEEDPWNDLTSTQQAELTKGKSVFITEEIPGHSWPSFTIYQLIAASPIQAAAVFWDVEYASHFVPDCLNVSISKCPAPNILEATYEIKMPIFSNEFSTVCNKVCALSCGGYQIMWQFLKSKYSKSGVGSFLVVQHEGKTLLRYRTLVTPSSSIACLLRGRAESQVKAVVVAIVDQINNEVKKSKGLLAKQVEQLEKATRKATSKE